MKVYIVHNLSDLPPFGHEGVAILDFSDAGEVSYLYGADPVSKPLEPSVKSILVPPHGSEGKGMYQIWNQFLGKGHKCLTLFTHFLSDVPDMEAAGKMYGNNWVEKTINDFLTYLKACGYQKVYFLCSRISFITRIKI
jgi:hypothetical protein